MGSRDQGFSHLKIPYEGIFLSLSEVLHTASSFERLPNLLTRLLVETIPPADAGILYLYDEGRKQLVAKTSHGYHCDNVEHSLRSKEGAPGQCYTLRKSLLFSSTETITGQMATLRPENLDYYSKMREGLPPSRSMVAIPLILGEKASGVVLLEHYKQHRRFKEADLLRLETLANWISLIIDDIQSHLELKRNKRSYRELLGKLITTSEDERWEIAREIHDEVNQLLLSVKVNLENMESSLPADLTEARKVLKVSNSRINQVFDELHNLVLGLRPPALDDLGLPQALEWYIQSWLKEANLSITMKVSGLNERRPAPVVETALFRIAQEALSNMIKHAQATSAKVKLNFGKSRLVLLVEDNGVGFDPDVVLHMSDNKGNLGLLGMKERAKLCGGTLKIDSGPGCGTCLKVEIPVSSYDWGAY